MDISLLKSEDQMAEMMLLMQMEKINPHHHHHELSGTGGGAGSNHHHHLTSAGLIPTGGYSPTSDSRGSSGSTSTLNPTISQELYNNHEHTDGGAIYLINNNNNINDVPPQTTPTNAGNWRTTRTTADGDEFLITGRTSPPPTTKQNSMAAMREMIFRIAAMQPIYIDPESVKPPKRRNVRISTDPQSVAARHRRERISEKIRILQRLVPGGTKMDTASMLDEAIHYVKFLKTQVQSLEQAAVNRPLGTVVDPTNGIGFPVPVSAGNGGYFSSMKGYPMQQMQTAVHHDQQL